jgi:hypothetical protein
MRYWAIVEDTLCVAEDRKSMAYHGPDEAGFAHSERPR